MSEVSTESSRCSLDLLLLAIWSTHVSQLCASSGISVWLIGPRKSSSTWPFRVSQCARSLVFGQTQGDPYADFQRPFHGVPSCLALCLAHRHCLSSEIPGFVSSAQQGRRALPGPAFCVLSPGPCREAEPGGVVGPAPFAPFQRSQSCRVSWPTSANSCPMYCVRFYSYL